VPKIISKRYELEKLCHSNRSGPVFLRHSVLIWHLITISGRKWLRIFSRFFTTKLDPCWV